jgi:hypothetical protein
MMTPADATHRLPFSIFALYTSGANLLKSRPIAVLTTTKGDLPMPGVKTKDGVEIFIERGR